MEDDIQFTCPNCAAPLGLDSVGDLELLAYPTAKPGERRGLGGLQTIEASGNPNWIQESYFFNDGSKINNASLEPPGVAGKPRANETVVDLSITPSSSTKRRRKKKTVEMTPDMQQAIDKDLSDKNIKLNLSDHD